MSKKAAALKPPSQQSVERVLTCAFNAPQANCQEAEITIAAIKEVAEFFRPMFAPQIKSQTAGAGIPQASATDAGKPATQG
jgi:hypothetical protein